MALESSLVPVLFDKGLEQKTNYKLAVPGAFLTLQNAVRKKAGLWEKRYGTTSLSKALSTSNQGSLFNATIGAGTRLGTFNDNIAMTDGRNLWAYAQPAKAWTIAQGVAAAVPWQHQALVRSQFDITGGDMAYCNGFVAVVFQSALYHQAFAIYDANTGDVVIAPQAIPEQSTDTSYARVAAIGNNFVFVFASTHGLGVMNYGATANAVPTIVVVDDNTLGLSYQYALMDVYAYDSTHAVLVCNSATNGITVALYNVTNNSITASAIHNGGAASKTADQVLTVHVEFGNILIAYAGAAASGLFAVAYNGTLTNKSAVSTIDTSSNTFKNATIVKRPNAAPLRDTPNNTTYCRLYYDVVTPAGQNQIWAADLPYDGTNGYNMGTGNMGLWYAGVSLASHAFFGVDESAYYYVLSDTTLQATYFLLRDDSIYITPLCVAKFAPTTASHYPTGSATLSHVTGDGTNFHAALRVQTSSDANPSESYGAPMPSPAINGLDHYSVSPSAGDYVCSNLGQGMQAACGGLMNHFDGLNISEIGFHQYPENITTTQATGGHLQTTQTYYFRVMWEWFDNCGQTHRSCPSVIQSVALTGTNNEFTISLPALNVGSKDAWYTNGAHNPSYRAIVYLAVAGDASVFYRHAVISPMQLPGKATNALTYTVTMDPDTTQEILYTTGGKLENIAPPAARCAHVHKNRMWLGGLETSELWFSKEHVIGEGIAFNDGLTVPIEEDGGDVTAFASLDDKLIIFKKDRLYYLVGDGPDDSGNNWDYPEPVRLPSDVGTIQPNTVMSLPSGVIFKSLKGWYLLNRGLAISYIGDRVEDFNGNDARSATLLSDQNEARFVHSNGDCLVYNYYFNQWSSFTNYTGVDSIVANGYFYRLGSDGTVHQEIAGQYNDDGTKYSLVVETSWLSLARLQGYQRIYALQLIADFVDDHQLKVEIAYDFKSTYNQTINFTTTGIISGTTLNLRIQPQIQKCTAIKVRLTDLDTISANGGASLKPTALAVEVGHKKGAIRIAPTQSL